jgi:hypothetical protein
MLTELKAIRSELVTGRTNSVRWAFANKTEIDTAISQWSIERMEEVKKAEQLSPQVEDAIRKYEMLQSELTRKQMEARGFRMPQRIGITEDPAAGMDIETLSKKVADMRAPIAEILERRDHQSAEYRAQYSTDRLITEYVGNRYDLVVDTAGKVLYRSAGEVPDITEGILAFFREKTRR